MLGGEGLYCFSVFAIFQGWRIARSGIADSFVAVGQIIQGYRAAFTKRIRRAARIATRHDESRTRRPRLGTPHPPFRASASARTGDLLRQRDHDGKEAATGETVGIITAIIALIAAGTNLLTAVVKARTEISGGPRRRQGGRHKRREKGRRTSGVRRPSSSRNGEG